MDDNCKEFMFSGYNAWQVGPPQPMPAMATYLPAERALQYCCMHVQLL